MASAALRQRYWARSMVGWPVMGAAKPNAAHQALAALGRQGRVSRLVTQNVDGLHLAAGSEEVIELHGAIRDVICMGCGRRTSRQSMQALLVELNPGVAGGSAAGLAAAAPDGDADLEQDFSRVVVPDCPHCGGLLKPDVVFFGDAVPLPRVTAALAGLAEASAMLVVGSSLMVYSGYRFCLRAAELGLPIAALNQGRTRADHLLSLKVATDCSQALARLHFGLT